MRKLALSTLFYALSAAGPLAAGTVITIDRRDLPDGTPEPMTISVEGQLIAIKADPDDGRFIFRGDRDQMLILNDETKTYMVLDASMMQGIASQMDNMKQQIEAAIAQLPEAQQEMARRAMQQQAPPPAQAAAAESEDDVRRTTERETRQGYPSVKYEVFEDDVKVQELWVTDWSNVQGQGDLSAAMQSFGAFTENLMSSMGGLAGDSSSSFGSSVASWWHGIDGMPVVITELENGTPVEESVVRSIEAADLDAGELFEVPDDYTLETIGGDGDSDEGDE
jgi:hypothetical protein